MLPELNAPARHGLAAAGMLVVSAILILPELGTQMLFGSDILLEFFYNRAYGFMRLGQGEIPLWNPYQFCGYPFVGAFQSAMFYPLNIVFLIFTPETAVSVCVVLHIMLSWLFMYMYVYHHTKRALPSFIAGVVFMLSGFLLSDIYAGHITIYCAYPWVPLVILALEKTIKGNSLAWSLAGGIFLSFQVLAGYPAMVFYTVIGLFLVFLWHIVSIYRKEQSIKALIRPAILSAVLPTSAVLLSAIQLIPTLVMTPHSARSGGVSYEFATSFSMPPENVFTFILPYLFGDMAGKVYWGRWYLWDMLAYVGVLPLFLLFAAGLTSKNKGRMLLFIAGVSILLSFGGYAGYYRLLYKYVPGFSMFRSPCKILLLFTFAASAGAGVGVKMLIEKKEEVLRVSRTMWKVLAGIMVLILLVLILSTEKEGGNSLFWKQVVGKSFALGDRVSAPTGILSRSFLEDTYSHARTSLWFSLLWLGLSLAVFRVALAKSRKIRMVFPVLLVAVIAADLLWASSRYIEPLRNHNFYLEPEVQEVLKATKQTAPTRFTSSRHTRDLSSGSLCDVAHAGGYDPAELGRYVEYCNALGERSLKESLVISGPIRPGRMIRLMGVSYVFAAYHKSHYPESKEIFAREEIGKVYELNNQVPRTFIVHQARVEPDKEKRLELLKTIDPLKEVVIEEPLQTKLEPLPPERSEKAEITEYTPHKVTMEADAATRGVLVLTDAYYPLWKATIDGKPAKVFPAYHLMRGVEIPAGKHTVTFHYNKNPFYFGAIVSLVSLIVSLAIIILSRLMGINKTES